MPKYHVHITRTTTYSVVAPNRDTAMDKALQGIGTELDQVTDSVRAEETDHEGAVLLYHQAPGQIPSGGNLSHYPSRAAGIRALRLATHTPDRIADRDVIAHLDERGHIIRMEPYST